MLDYKQMLENTKQKYQKNNGDVITEYYKYNKEGSNIISLNNIQNFDKLPITQEQKDTCSNISLTTTVMDRGDFLNQSLQTWVKFPFKKIVIIDWSSKVPVEQSIKEHFGLEYTTYDSRIEIIRVDDKIFYEHSGARNEKMKYVDGWVLSIDSDVLLSPRFGNCIKLGDNKKVIYMNDKDKNDKALYGTSIFHKDEYDSVGGCNEDFHGWGSEDVDLYTRMVDNGCKTRPLVAHTLYHIPHDDFERAINTKHDDVFESMASNNIKLYGGV